MQNFRCFNDTTNGFSHVYKPTSHEFLEQVLNIAGAFNEGEKIEEIQNFVVQMKLKLLNLFLIFILLHLFLILGLTTNLIFLKDILETYYSCQD